METSYSFSTRAPGPPERRTQERHVKILRVGVFVVEGRRELCLIRNISAGGLMAHVYSPVKVGQQVIVELKTHEKIPGRIAWVRDSNAGVAFDMPVDIEALLANPVTLDNGWRARSPRIEVDRAATIRVDGVPNLARIRDISQSGAKIETAAKLVIDGDVVITPEGFRPIGAVARWQEGERAGIVFNEVIRLNELIAWIKSA
ncbi:PilZ domain-containing protein [Sphingosinicella sp.]|uniref:PilZ domain-containing protein n=1 Tax=Sphingosinicella sp. TaxID=1917971 RepID=UPI0040377CB5